MVDVGDFFPGVAAKHVLEDDEVACSKDDAAAGEGRMDAGFAVEGAAHVDGATTGDAAHVV